MDTQIWYAIWSSVIGAFVGLLQHLGEVCPLITCHMLDLQAFFPRDVRCLNLEISYHVVVATLRYSSL